jgi:GMP synthase-like glutamine amidotransferase
MTRTRLGRILVLDPGCVKPETEVYNTFNRMFSELTQVAPGVLDCIQFVVPKIGGMRLRDMASDCDVAGIISLGSVANVTDNHKWVETLCADLEPLLFEQGIPFYGSCFSHQLLAWIVGNEVDFLRNRQDVPGRKYRGKRKIQVAHPKMGVLFADMRPEDYLSGNAADLEFVEACQNLLSWKRLDWSYAKLRDGYHTARENRFLGFCDERVPSSFVARVAHEQEVWSNVHPDFAVAASSSACAVDGLVHLDLPIFSLQSHPEWPERTGDGWRFLKNFLYFVLIKRRNEMM